MNTLGWTIIIAISGLLLVGIPIMLWKILVWCMIMTENVCNFDTTDYWGKP